MARGNQSLLSARRIAIFWPQEQNLQFSVLERCRGSHALRVNQLNGIITDGPVRTYILPNWPLKIQFGSNSTKKAMVVWQFENRATFAPGIPLIYKPLFRRALDLQIAANSDNKCRPGKLQFHGRLARKPVDLGGRPA
jgi:hypothetical protein